jgi:penicillin-binding protein 2
MLSSFIKRFIRKKRNYEDINPEDIFIDSANLPGYESSRLEGRIERPVGDKMFLFIKVAMFFGTIVLVLRLWSLGVTNGALYTEISENNRLSHTTIFANRGVIYDRNMLELATNTIKSDQDDFAGRQYSSIKGLAHVVGYVKYPSHDSKGIYYEENYQGRDGVELYYGDLLSGKNGLKLSETDVSHRIISESVVERPVDGPPLILTIDARISEALHENIKLFVEDYGFVGGVGVIMDVINGEILALTSYPEYDQNLLTDGNDSVAINNLLSHPSKPFLNRAIGGVYAPGSIIKPILALAALNEKLITPEKKIYSSGFITVPNPYEESKPSIFRDWKAHGWTNMKEAIAVSSDVYFYSIGGGYGDQNGLGITKIDNYLKLFEIDKPTGIDLFGEVVGIIPTPEWKKNTFDGDIWRLGDTYITSIGQFGTLVTPIEAVKYVGAIANGGKLLMPKILKNRAINNPEQISRLVEFSDSEWQVVKEGMRGAVTFGTAGRLNVPYIEVAAKTGTAEIGAGKRYVHSWVVGYFPYRNPRYAFAIVAEKGPTSNQVGASAIMRGVFDWMLLNTTEYLK